MEDDQAVSPEEQQRQRSACHMLVRDAVFATDTFLIDNADTLARITAASRTRLTLEVAIGYLLSRGLITATPTEDRPEWIRVDLPDYMRPDLSEAVEAWQQMSARRPIPSVLTQKEN